MCDLAAHVRPTRPCSQDRGGIQHVGRTHCSSRPPQVAGFAEAVISLDARRRRPTQTRGAQASRRRANSADAHGASGACGASDAGARDADARGARDADAKEPRDARAHACGASDASARGASCSRALGASDAGARTSGDPDAHDARDRAQRGARRLAISDSRQARWNSRQTRLQPCVVLYSRVRSAVQQFAALPLSSTATAFLAVLAIYQQRCEKVAVGTGKPRFSTSNTDN